MEIAYRSGTARIPPNSQKCISTEIVSTCQMSHLLPNIFQMRFIPTIFSLLSRQVTDHCAQRTADMRQLYRLIHSGALLSFACFAAISKSHKNSLKLGGTSKLNLHTK